MFIHKHKCSKCGQPATVQLTRIEGGKVRDLYLCDEHAAEMSRTYHHLKQKSLSEILEGLLKQSEAEGKTTQPSAPPDLRCIHCRLPFDQYQRNLLLGCSVCYRSFREQLIQHLRRFHGATQHVGRRPGGGMARPRLQPPSLEQLARESAAPTSKQPPEAPAPPSPPQPDEIARRIEELTREMQRAIAAEDYSKAARCRDQIRRLKATLSQTPPPAP